MASVYRQKRNGKDLAAWRFKYRDWAGDWKYGVGWLSKRKTMEHALALEAEHRAVRVGEKEAPPAWMEKRGTPFQEVVDAYLLWGNCQGGRYGRPWDDQNAALRKADLEWWRNELGLGTLADVDLGRVEEVIQAMFARGLAPKTVASKVAAIRALVLWSIRRGFLKENPLVGMARMDTKALIPHRPLTDPEVAALLKVAPPPRDAWYRCALGTGFRVAELRSLRCRDLDPFGPSLFLAAAFSKDRKDHRQPITKDLAQRLQALAEGKDPDVPLLGIPKAGSHKANRYDPSGLLQKDLRAAGIPLSTHEGKTTWHSLRKAFVTNVVRSGADLKSCMALARHSTAALTMETYAAADPARLREVAEAAEERVEQAVLAASCCTGVARKIAGGEGIAVSAKSGKGLQRLEMVGDTGLESALPLREENNPKREIPHKTRENGAFREYTGNVSDDSACCTRVAHRKAENTQPLPPDLAELVALWPSLPPAFREGILAAARAATGGR